MKKLVILCLLSVALFSCRTNSQRKDKCENELEIGMSYQEVESIIGRADRKHHIIDGDTITQQYWKYGHRDYPDYELFFIGGKLTKIVYLENVR